ncbi:hypothetical protein E2562_038638 [Oryza meyeriana var. granulata]|uniref:Uncharacterized protein n=1 Tax=Oryza meyeriana var. granulata TaxID=110450 RepID=A0A6G1DTN6_9ORYZ|nr:hypothetical protein E2562_038638 [Oryza meyeriana var. granulata]
MKNNYRKRKLDSNDGDEPATKKLKSLNWTSLKVVIDACAALSPTHVRTLTGLHLDGILQMTLEGLEQRNLVSWLVSCIDPDTMIINISDEKKLAITPRTVHNVLGIPIGEEKISYPDYTAAKQAYQSLCEELNVDVKSNITYERLVNEIKQRPDDAEAVRFFIMILINKLLIPTTSLHIIGMNAYLAIDLSGISKVDWSRLVLELLRNNIHAWQQSAKV